MKAVDIDGLTGIEYKKIIHSVNFEGMIIKTNIRDDDEYINEEAIVQGPPIMYTKEEGKLAMDELNDSFFIPTHKTTRQRNKDIAPICIVKIKYIGGVQLNQPLLCLFDSGSTGTLVNRRCLPPGAFINNNASRVITTTANGDFDSSKTIHLEHIQFPEFVNGRVCQGLGDA